jgi:uncharacterized protein YqgC (DUF456 family)
MPEGGALVALCAAVLAVGLLGAVVPILPGLSLCLASVFLWAYFGEHGTLGWTVFGICAAWFVVGTVLKYVWAAARVKRGGVPGRTLLVAGVLGLIGMFVIPVLGLFIGFVAGVWLMEAQRLGGTEQAWPATVVALKAVGLAIVIELAAGALIAGTWLIGVLLTYAG